MFACVNQAPDRPARHQCGIFMWGSVWTRRRCAGRLMAEQVIAIVLMSAPYRESGLQSMSAGKYLWTSAAETAWWLHGQWKAGKQASTFPIACTSIMTKAIDSSAARGVPC